MCFLFNQITMKKLIYSIITLAILLTSTLQSCKNADQETDYTDYGTSIFQADADAMQAGLDVSTASGVQELSMSRGVFFATLDNNSKVFSVNLKWLNFPSYAAKAQLFAPADSGVFVSKQSMWDIYIYTTPSLKFGELNVYRMETTALRDYEEEFLKQGKCYFTFTSLDYTPTSGAYSGTKISLSGSHALTINGVSVTGYGAVRGQIELEKTFFKSKPTLYYKPQVDNDSVTTPKNIAANGNLVLNDTKSNCTSGSTATTDIANKWVLISTQSESTNVVSRYVNNVYTYKYFVGVWPANGSVNVNTNGTYTYTPNADFTGTDYFLYRIVDANGKKSHLAYVKITVN